ncbi:interferon-related developmental regulator [Fennellomyces sp. T-0311]|nr:interferon-related developmental regulator [Fennellomyces sp. T-0311]
MPRNLAKKAGKQQTRIAALNTLGTPASSRAGSDDEDHVDIDETSLADQLRHAVDDLGEKRASVREAALTRLNRFLSYCYCGDYFDANPANQEALLQLLMRSLRKPGSTLEAILAAKGIGLAFINNGADDQDELFGMVLSLLKNTMTDASDVRLKHQCIETLALITLIAASDADTKGGLDYFYKLLVSNGSSLQPDTKLSQGALDELLCTTLRAYGLLYASVFGDGRAGWEDAWDESQGVMPVHLDFLESASKESRVAAGENVALMFDCVHVSHKHATEDDVEEMPEYEEMDELIDMLQRLSTDSNRRVNKQDRKEQKSAFRDIIRSIESGSRPKQKLKIDGQPMIFRGWGNVLNACYRHSMANTKQ